MDRLTWSNFRNGLVHFASDYTWTFVVVLIITVVSTAFSIQYLTAIESRLQDVFENDVRGGDGVQAALTALVCIESAAKDLALSTSASEHSQAVEDLGDSTNRLKSFVRNSAPRFYTPKAKAALSSTQSSLKQFLEVEARLLEAGAKTPDGEGLAELKASAAKLRKGLELLVSNRIANSTKGVDGLLDQLKTTLIFTIVLLVLTVLVRIVLYWAGHPRRQADS
jgi:hypothetical protein